MLPRVPKPLPYIAERSQERSIHVKRHDYPVYVIIRTSEGWKVYPNTSARTPSRVAHADVTDAARAYLKGGILKTIGTLGREIELEILAETAHTLKRWTMTSLTGGGGFFFESPDGPLVTQLVYQWCCVELPQRIGMRRDATDPVSRKSRGIRIRDAAAATAFRLQWC